MSLFRFNWLRNLIRRNTNPIPEERAYFWKNRLSIAYMLLAWNSFGFVMYMIYSGNAEWGKKYLSEEMQALTPAQQWTRTLGIKDAKVIRVSGFNISRYEIHNDFDKIAESEASEHEDEDSNEAINLN